MNEEMMKLIEESAGVGDLMLNGQALRRVAYRLNRYQGLAEGSGLPIPGLFRIEGSVDFDASKDSADWIGALLMLRLDDGRTLGITIVDSDGRIFSEGHGPLKCQCC
jgi:hypothetical protein